MIKENPMIKGDILTLNDLTYLATSDYYGLALRCDSKIKILIFNPFNPLVIYGDRPNDGMLYQSFPHKKSNMAHHFSQFNAKFIGKLAQRISTRPSRFFIFPIESFENLPSNLSIVHKFNSMEVGREKFVS
jgi:hypothetical protein